MGDSISMMPPDLAQRPAGFWAAGEFARLADRGDEVPLGIDPPRHLHQAAQAFAGHQHQVVERRCDETPDPGLDRRGIGGVMDGEHRTLQHIGALFGQQAGKLCFLARFQDQDAVTVQSVGHYLALTVVACCLFIMALGRGLAQGCGG
jgi:hypothetical protein